MDKEVQNGRIKKFNVIVVISKFSIFTELPFYSLQSMQWIFITSIIGVLLGGIGFIHLPTNIPWTLSSLSKSIPLYFLV